MNYTHEITYLLKSEEDAPLVSEIIRGAGAHVEHEEPLRKIQLAYPIRREAFAFLGILRIRGEAPQITEFDSRLRGEDRILRYLITRPLFPRAAGDRALREGRPSGGPATEGRRTFVSQPASHTLSNEALQEKIEEILQ